jgi:hypothetical protein
MNNLKAFEKFLQGYKTYLLSIASIVYGVVVMGYQQHQWTTLGGAWTWVFSGSFIAALRAAFAVYVSNLLSSSYQPPQLASTPVDPNAPH